MKNNLTVAIAGATGFVGGFVVQALLDKGHKVVALSRKTHEPAENDHLVWKTCDVFSLEQVTSAIKDCDVAIYLVHSMIPTAKLSQGDFSDYDLVLADNFARAAKTNKLKQIIYISGIVPDDYNLSKHLLSRLEVENALIASGVPTTTLRAAMILGANSSSFQMIYRLVRRLPIMVCPSWTRTLSNPISVEDAVEYILHCIGNSEVQNKHYDIGGKTTLSYIDMMRILGEKMGRKPIMFTLPFFSPVLSRIWVSLFSSAPKDLVYPLICSLKTHVIPNIHYLLPLDTLKPKSYGFVIDEILNEENTLKNNPHAYSYTDKKKFLREVRSIQRIDTLYRFNAKDVAKMYFNWIPKYFLNFIQVESVGTQIHLMCRSIKTPLMILESCPEESNDEYQLFHICGGLLDANKTRGRLIFRTIIKGRYTMLEIHDYVPKLPWYFYRYSQALIHSFTIYSFNKFIVAAHKNLKVDEFVDEEIE